MVYTVDEQQLLRLWSVMSCFECLREIQDPALQSALITNAQTFLTAFVLDLKPSLGDQAERTTLRPVADKITGFDA